MKNANRDTQLFTTHCQPDKKPRMIAQPAIINGKWSLAYMKDEKVESYVPLEEARMKFCKENVPEITVGF